MERFLGAAALEEIFQDDSVGNFQKYAARIRQLHHHFLTSQLVPEQRKPLISFEGLQRLATDAEYLATQYTNPLVVEEIQGLPTKDIPSRQLVQDALALAGTIFEFLGDTITLNEPNGSYELPLGISVAEESFDDGDLEAQQLHKLLGPSSSLYLKAALCYALGRYESRTHVILERLAERIFVHISNSNEELTIANSGLWANYLLCALVGRNLSRIGTARDKVGKQIASLRAQLRHIVVSEGLTASTGLMSMYQLTQIGASLWLIEASLSSTDAFLQGNMNTLRRAQEQLSKAVDSARSMRNYELIWVIRTVGKVLSRMWADSPWGRLDDIITRKTYLRQLIRDGIVTFWSSQIAALTMRSEIGALAGGYLDDRIKRVVIHMPTSAGKTLLAELAIVVQSFSSSNNKCVYVGPSRALCDQVAADLSDRLSRFRIRVTALVSDSDLSDYENILFKQSSVIVITPEKLSYLFRQRHPSVHEAALFIFDELHNISRSERGWAYEEIISLLLQHSQTHDAKMIFLSAVMPNHLKVQEWVDPERTGNTISELWQPTRLLKGAITFEFKRPTSEQVTLSGDLIYVRDKEDLNTPLRIQKLISSKQVRKKPYQAYWQRDSQRSDGEIQHAVAASGRFAKLGPVLVYCPRRADAVSFCELAKSLDLSFLRWSGEQEAGYREIIAFARERLPEEHPLIEALEHRIAFHHAGLPRDVRNEIEYAFRQGWIHILAATTTLVEGVNLPVKTLILTDYCFQRLWDKQSKKHNMRGQLSKSDFRNIAGRAGRSLYETEGQVVFIQSMAGYPYPLDESYNDYLALEADSPELNITSALIDDNVLSDLNRLVEEVDNGRLSERTLLFEFEQASDKLETVKVVNKLHVFTLLLQDQALVSEDEESFVRIFQGTLLGKQRPDIAPRILGAFAHRSAKALTTLISHPDTTLFAQTGLKIPTCRRLMSLVREYWEKHGADLEYTASKALDYETLYEIATIIYSLEDSDVTPQPVTLAREGKGSKTKQRLVDDSAFFAEWIISHHTEALLNKHFAFIPDPAWRAEQYTDYTQQTLGYRASWALSAFWLFSKAIVESRHKIDLASTPLGRELLLLPAYAKFGVYTPAAALFSSFGLSPSMLTRRLGSLYEEQFGNDRYNYPLMLQWLLNIHDLDLKGEVELPYIRRLNRFLSSLKSWDDASSIWENERNWEAEFRIAGWRHYTGESILQHLSIGETVILRPEPNNPFGQNAVAIHTENGVILGHVPQSLAKEISDRISITPVRARISKINLEAPIYDRVYVYCTDS